MMTVASFLQEKGLVPRLEAALAQQECDASLIDTVAPIPVRRSRAVRRFGSYIARGSDPVAIRLQFALSEAELIETFLHELAHCLDHLTRSDGTRNVRPHGPGWQQWAKALGIAAKSTGRSDVLQRLQEKRLKVVAVCRKCGFEVRRLRRLPRGRHYVHNGCGGRLELH